jgi:hypothetical protein
MTIKTTWATVETKPAPIKPIRAVKPPKKQRDLSAKPLMKLAESQKVLRDYVAKNPATIMKVIAHKLGWTQSKAEFVKSTMKGEFYERGLILKSEVRIG